MAITPEDTMTLLNIRATSAQKRKELKTLMNILETGKQATLDQQISEKKIEIETYHNNQNDPETAVDDATFRKHFGELQQQRLTLIDQNRQIIESNAAYEAGATSLNAQIAAAEAAIQTADESEQTLLETVSLGAPDKKAPSLQKQIDDLSKALIASKGVKV